MGKGTLLCDHMETEQYKTQEMLSTASSETEKKHHNIKRAEPKEKSWFYYTFGNFLEDTTDELEKVLASLQEESKDRRALMDDLPHMLVVKRALYKVSLELLMRRNPQVRELAEAVQAIGKRKYELQRAWEKEVLAREGEEGLKRRKQNGEGTGRQYTREELDIRIRYIQAQVDVGILPPSALEHELAEQKAGGFYQWNKERQRKNDIFNIQQLAAVNHPTTGNVLENIRRLNEEEYGKEYAEQQHTILAELAKTSSQKVISIISDDTTH
jgi:hypothetical protein